MSRGNHPSDERNTTTMKITTYEIHDSKTTARVGEIYALPSEAKKINAMINRNPFGDVKWGDVSKSELAELDCVSSGLREKLAHLKSVYLVEV